MKATKVQYDDIANGIDNELNKMNLTRAAIVDVRDCWILFDRWLRSISENRPIGFGTARAWKCTGLNDSHIETVFRKFAPQLRR